MGRNSVVANVQIADMGEFLKRYKLHVKERTFQDNNNDNSVSNNVSNGANSSSNSGSSKDFVRKYSRKKQVTSESNPEPVPTDSSESVPKKKWFQRLPQRAHNQAKEETKLPSSTKMDHTSTTKKQESELVSMKKDFLVTEFDKMLAERERVLSKKVDWELQLARSKKESNRKAALEALRRKSWHQTHLERVRSQRERLAKGKQEQKSI